MYRGVDNRVWVASQTLGTGTWHDNGQIGGAISESPVIAALPNGNMLVDALDTSRFLWQQVLRFNNGGFDVGGWQQESQHWQSNVVPYISILGSVAYLLLTGINGGFVYWKPGYNGS